MWIATHPRANKTQSLLRNCPEDDRETCRARIQLEILPSLSKPPRTQAVKAHFRICLFSMKKRLVLSIAYSLFALDLSASAEGLSALVGQLDSNQTQERTEARNQIQQLLTEAAAPGSAATRATLEQETLRLLGSGVSHPAQVWLIRMLEWTGGDASVPTLAAYLADKDEELRDCARRALTANPSDAATAALVRAQAGARPEECRAYIDSFAYRADPRAAKLVARFLRAKDAATVAQAANALLLFGDSSSYTALAAAHDSAPAEARPAIELAMLATGADAQACQRLIQSGANVGVAEAAFIALAAQDAVAASQTLDAALAEEPTPLRRAILGAAMDEPRLRTRLIAKLSSLSPEDQMIVLTGIAEQALSENEAAVIALIHSPDQDVRRQAISTLGVIGGADSFRPLYALFLKDGNDLAARSLAQLDLPEVNAELLKTIQKSSNSKQRASAIQLFALRHADGAAELFNGYLVPGNPDELRIACLKALESIGTVESCQIMAKLITADDPVKRGAQQSLKRLCLNFDAPDRLWNAVFIPALETAQSTKAREDLLAIADAVPGQELLNFIKEQAANKRSTLRPAALKALQRWPDMEAGELWIEIATAPSASASDLKAAQAGLSRIAKSKRVRGWEKLKLNIIVEAVEKAPTPEFKKAMIACYAKPSGYIQHYLHDAFEPYLDDPVIGAEVRAVSRDSSRFPRTQETLSVFTPTPLKPDSSFASSRIPERSSRAKTVRH